MLARPVEKGGEKRNPPPVIIGGKRGAGGAPGTEFVVPAKTEGSTGLFAYGAGCRPALPRPSASTSRRWSPPRAACEPDHALARSGAKRNPIFRDLPYYA